MKKQSKVISKSNAYRLEKLSDSKDYFSDQIEKNQVGLLDILLEYKSLHLDMNAFF